MYHSGLVSQLFVGPGGPAMDGGCLMAMMAIDL